MRIRRRAVALGIFDGVHLGHRAVMELTENNGIPAVFTFDNTSLRTKQGRMIEYIYTDAQKESLIRSLGIINICSEDFSCLKDMSGSEFAENILAGKLGATSVACGRDFRFGRNASCGISELAVLGRRFGFDVMVAEDVLFNGTAVSSGKIRSLLSQGDVTAASKLLGRNYFVSGKIVHGNEIGRTINFPTINQEYSDGQLVPKYGVYQTVTDVDGVKYKSITNVGVKPTIKGERKPLAETHILDFDGDLYNEYIEVEFCKFIRPEMKFSSVEELKKQISKDVSDSITKY